MKAGSTIIAPVVQHAMLMEQLLQNQDAISDIRLQPLSVFLGNSNNQSEDYFSALERLNELNDSLTILAPYLSHPLFIKEILQFHEYFTCFHIDLNTLPIENETQKELAVIFQTLDKLKTTKIQQFHYLSELSKEALDSVFISEYFISDILEQYFIDLLLEKGAHFLPLEKTQFEQATLWKASNQRIEVEGVAQYLSQKNDCSKTLILYSHPSYEALFDQLFPVYQIPYQNQTFQYPSLVPKQFLLLLDFVQTFTYDAFIKALASNAFSFPDPVALYEYITYFQLSPDSLIKKEYHYQAEHYHEFNIANQNALKDLFLNASEGLDICSSLLAELKVLHQTRNFEKTCVFLYEYLAQQSYCKAENDAFLQLSQILEDNLSSLLKTENPAYHLEYLLSRIQVHEEKELVGCTILPLTSSFLSGYETIIMMGSNSDYFPSISSYEGIIDEHYLTSCFNFPNMETRYQQYTKQKECFLQLGKELIITYHYGDYNGKEKSLVFEIEYFAQLHKINIEEIPLKENNQTRYSKENLNATLAQQLFFNDHHLYGSISSFETYFKCPYAYFLRQGLRLYNSSLPQVDAAYLGSLLHAVMEQLLKEKGKNYANVSYEEVKNKVEVEFSQIRIFYEKETNKYQYAIQRITKLLYQSFFFLKDLEEHSSFIPVNSEVRFSHTIPLGTFNIEINGIIDRVDEMSHYFRILDFKSSNQSLSAPEVLAGVKLQLLTYAWVYQQLLAKNLMGAYYFSFSSGNIATDAYQLSRRPKSIQEITTSQHYDSYLKNRQLAGWTFVLDESLDDDAKHIRGLSTNKDNQLSVRSGVYEFSKVNQFIQEIYTVLAQELWDGNISLTPSVEACTFCDYKAICQFKGQVKPLESRVEITSFRKDKAS